jgi:5-methylcytosine-specific restriction endonuclease McrA
MKTCCRCKQPLPLSDFNLDRGSKDGRDRMCRHCRKAQKAEYYERNREKVIAKVSEYQKANPEKVNERSRRSYQKHREERLAYHAAYRGENSEVTRQRGSRSRDRNREHYSAKNKAHRTANPSMYAGYAQTRRARQVNAPVVEIIDRAAIVERDGAICQLCLTAVDLSLPHRHPMSLTLDHIIPLAKGGNHSADNLQVAHWRCNSRKNATLRR